MHTLASHKYLSLHVMMACWVRGSLTQLISKLNIR